MLKVCQYIKIMQDRYRNQEEGADERYLKSKLEDIINPVAEGKDAHL